MSHPLFGLRRNGRRRTVEGMNIRGALPGLDVNTNWRGKDFNHRDSVFDFGHHDRVHSLQTFQTQPRLGTKAERGNRRPGNHRSPLETRSRRAGDRFRLQRLQGGTRRATLDDSWKSGLAAKHRWPRRLRVRRSAYHGHRIQGDPRMPSFSKYRLGGSFTVGVLELRTDICTHWF